MQRKGMQACVQARPCYALAYMHVHVQVWDSARHAACLHARSSHTSPCTSRGRHQAAREHAPEAACTSAPPDNPQRSTHQTTPKQRQPCGVQCGAVGTAERAPTPPPGGTLKAGTIPTWCACGQRPVSKAPPLLPLMSCCCCMLKGLRVMGFGNLNPLHSLHWTRVGPRTATRERGWTHAPRRL